MAHSNITTLRQESNHAERLEQLALLARLNGVMEELYDADVAYSKFTSDLTKKIGQQTSRNNLMPAQEQVEETQSEKKSAAPGA